MNRNRIYKYKYTQLNNNSGNQVKGISVCEKQENINKSQRNI